MRNRKCKYDWNEIQEYYDLGYTWRQLIEKFGMVMATLVNAQRKGWFISRSRAYARQRHNEIYGAPKHTEETKKKISAIRIKFLEEHPEKVPYLLNHSRKESYPESYFREYFGKEKLPLKQYLQVGIYELDFYNEETKLDVEIDGEQHYLTEKTIAADERRDSFLREKGWRTYRIKWSDYRRLLYVEHQKVIQDIKNLLENKSV